MGPNIRRSYQLRDKFRRVTCPLQQCGSPHYKLSGKWYCSYLEFIECYDHAMLPVDEVQIELLRMSDIGLGTTLYTKKQLNELAGFQESQGTRRAELAYNGGLLWGPRHSCWNEFYSHTVPNIFLRFRDKQLM